MNPTALLAIVFALQGAGQQKPPANPPAPTQTVPPVSADLPPKFTAPAPGAGSAVAKVDGQPIYAHDVESLLWESSGPQVVEDVVTLVMVRRAAAAQSIKVTQPEVEQRFKEDLALYEQRTRDGQQARPPGVSVEEDLFKKGYPLSRLYLNTEVEVILDKMAERNFKADSYVKVSLMFFRAENETPAADQAALKKAQAAVAQLKSGVKWETVITTSQLPAQYMKTGGLMGWLDYSSFSPEMLTQLKPLGPGQTSQPIKRSAGPQDQPGPPIYQIFRIEQLGSKAVGTDLDQLKKSYVAGAHATLLAAIRAAAKVERFPIKEPTGPTATPGKQG